MSMTYKEHLVKAEELIESAWEMMSKIGEDISNFEAAKQLTQMAQVHATLAQVEQQQEWHDATRAES